MKQRVRLLGTKSEGKYFSEMEERGLFCKGEVYDVLRTQGSNVIIISPTNGCEYKFAARDVEFVGEDEAPRALLPEAVKAAKEQISSERLERDTEEAVQRLREVEALEEQEASLSQRLETLRASLKTKRESLSKLTPKRRGWPKGKPRKKRVGRPSSSKRGRN